MITTWSRNVLDRNAAIGTTHSIISNEECVAMAKAEGVSGRLVTIRTKARKAFASIVASYEPIRAATNHELAAVKRGCVAHVDGF